MEPGNVPHSYRSRVWGPRCITGRVLAGEGCREPVRASLPPAGKDREPRRRQRSQSTLLVLEIQGDQVSKDGPVTAQKCLGVNFLTHRWQLRSHFEPWSRATCATRPVGNAFPGFRSSLSAHQLATLGAKPQPGVQRGQEQARTQHPHARPTETQDRPRLPSRDVKDAGLPRSRESAALES